MTTEQWVNGLDKPCILRLFSAYGFPVNDAYPEHELRAMMIEAVENGTIDASRHYPVAA